MREGEKESSSSIIFQYNQRVLIEWCLSNYAAEKYQQLRHEDNPKFFQNGRVKPFYGFSCVAWISPGTPAYENLVRAQEILKHTTEKEGIVKNIAFVKPSTFHMTIADIDPSFAYNRENKPFIPVTIEQFFMRLRQMKWAFDHMARYKEVQAYIKGVGLKLPIVAPIWFDSEGDLRKVRSIRSMIEKNTDSFSSFKFAGHISLAYLLRFPSGRDLKKLLDCLVMLDNHIVSDITFSRVDFVYFSSMDRYISLLSKNLITDETREYDYKDILKECTFASSLISLDATSPYDLDALARRIMEEGRKRKGSSSSLIVRWGDSVSQFYDSDTTKNIREVSWKNSSKHYSVYSFTIRGRQDGKYDGLYQDFMWPAEFSFLGDEYYEGLTKEKILLKIISAIVS